MRRIAALASLLLPFVACLGGSRGRPEGSVCEDDDDCRGSLVCRFGHCRPTCLFDGDCPGDLACVVSPDGSRVCQLVSEPGCETVDCEEGYVCVDGDCVPVAPPPDGDGDSDLDGDGDVDVDSDGNVDSESAVDSEVAPDGSNDGDVDEDGCEPGTTERCSFCGTGWGTTVCDETGRWGPCEGSCGPRQTCCEDACVDTDSDELNCGTCGYVCPSATPDCCRGGCVDTETDLRHCGECGTICGIGLMPACCDSRCYNLFDDEDHCGSCDISCIPGTQTCNSGTCTNIF